MGWLRRSVERQWYSRPDWLWLFWPLSVLFRLLSDRRRKRLSRTSYKSALPVVIVGNISVGGTGKTPALIAFAKSLQDRGFHPVVISRGYGADGSSVRQVPPRASAAEFGDEPVLIAAATGLPVLVGANRVAVVQYVERHHSGDVILSDDGLQHYQLGRDWEIAVVDAARRLGNGYCLPLGPLREAPQRLQEVDAVLLNGGDIRADWLPSGKTYPMTLRPVAWRHILSGELRALSALRLDGATAIAGIGNPQRFFATLRELGFRGTRQEFPDHHSFTPADFSRFGDGLMLMTEKDAVKVQPFAAASWWALVVEAQMPDEVIDRLCHRLAESRSH